MQILGQCIMRPCGNLCATLRARLICMSAYLAESGAPETWRYKVHTLKHFIVAEQVIAEDAVQGCIGGL